MYKLLVLFSLSLITVLSGFSQEKIDVAYTELVYREDFSKENEDWPFISSYENLFGIDKDEYFMHRMNPNLPYALMSNWKVNLKTFNILTALKLGPADEAKQSIGIIFLVQPDGQGALVFEINKFKQYRIKQLDGKFYRYLTGDKENQGWVKSGQVKTKNEYNEFDVRVKDQQVDFYLNEKFLVSYDVEGYKPGSMGLLIGPNTKAKADYFYVYSTPEAVIESKLDEEKEVQEEEASAALTRAQYDLEQMKRNLASCEAENEQNMEKLGSELAKEKEKVEALTISNNQLRDFKDRVLVEIDEDVFLTLTTELKEEIQKNEMLMREVKQYKDSLWMSHNKYRKLKVALLDKAITKGKKNKAERDKKEAKETKKEIEEEIKTDKLIEEQEEWELENKDLKVELDSTFLAEPVEEKVEEVKAEEIPIPEPEEPELKEAIPADIPIKKAEKRQD